MQRLAVPTLVTGILASLVGIGPALADPVLLNPDGYAQELPRRAAPADPASAPQRPPADVRYAPEPVNLGGGFIEFLFGGGRSMAPPRPPSGVAMARGDAYAEDLVERTRSMPDRKFDRQVVSYHGPEKPGTVVVDTPQRFLFLVQDNGTAIRYGIGVGQPGFAWAGVKTISAKKEWPDWTPPPEMLQRRPDLPNWMAGGPENPLGARALYLGSSLYRIHGSNEPWTIGQAVSSGCIRMRNEDVVDLYERVKVGTKVLVI
jgi:lipoprotein-anchoring transpeptidase ErfK/SrfK